MELSENSSNILTHLMFKVSTSNPCIRLYLLSLCYHVTVSTHYIDPFCPQRGILRTISSNGLLLDDHSTDPLITNILDLKSAATGDLKGVSWLQDITYHPKL